MFIIQLCNVSKSFQSKVVLNDISLSLEEGEFFGLLGPSGAGKTTLIKLLTGQLSCDDGTIRVFQEDAHHVSNEALANIGMVMDNSGLYDRLSCYDNLRLFTKVFGVEEKRIKEVLAIVELSDALHKEAGKLSKGMRQRLILARAMLHNPSLLFLDELTAGLDPATARRIHELILDLKKKGTTIFLTTHNMEEAYKLCDHIALLNDGHIIEYGSPQEICRRYNKKNKIHVLCKDGQHQEFENHAKSADALSQLLKQEEIVSIHSSEPDLESVFIELTGRRFV